MPNDPNSDSSNQEKEYLAQSIAKAKKKQSMADWIGLHIFFGPFKDAAKQMKKKRQQIEEGTYDE